MSRAQPDMWSYASIMRFPQWTEQTIPRYSHHQPLWHDEHAVTAEAIYTPKTPLCAQCGKLFKECSCNECVLCHTSLWIMGQRHHCRKCWSTVCNDCWKRTRHMNPMSKTQTLAVVCNDCAIYRALSSLEADMQHLGIYLLCEAAEMPLRCVGHTCGALGYGPRCLKCDLPTVPANKAHVERLVRTNFCCRKNARCSRCSKVEKLMEEEEKKRGIAREAIAQDPTAEDRCFSAVNLAGVFTGVDEATSRKMLLASVCASVCYEYAFFPNTTMDLSDIPYAKLLRLRQTQQLYSIFEGPNNVMYVAFPGTHDMRTTLTDIKFQRVTDTQWGNLHDGKRADGTMLNGGVIKLWEFKAHSGFYVGEAKLRKVLPTSICRHFVARGYSIVFCGHSLGGALASLVTLRHLTEDLATFQNKVLCVTLGAPLIGNTALTEKIKICGWTQLFHHIVYRSDIVPRLLTARVLPKVLVDAVRSTIGAVSSRLPSNWTSSSSGTPPPQSPSEAPSVTEQSFSSAEQFEDDGDASPLHASAAFARVPFACYGRYHFLHRENFYDSTTDENVAFKALQSSAGLGFNVMDHLLGSYNRSIAFHTLQPHVAEAVAQQGPGQWPTVS